MNAMLQATNWGEMIEFLGVTFNKITKVGYSSINKK